MLPCLLTLALSAPPAFAPADVAFYEKQVAPLLKDQCLKCHGADEKKLRGGLKLTSRAAVLRGGDTGPAADLKDPDKSLMLLAVRNKRPDGGDVMPPTGALPADKVEVLAKWVKSGLAVPAALADDGGEVPHEKPVAGGKDYWAYKPVAKPVVPTVKDAAWAKNPVDAFVRAKLDAAGLPPNGRAEKLALARRAYYDLTGLPPTPDKLDAFGKDDRPDAYAKLVDELLASPHYGEKWGRHWLDVVRYAETNGYERDGPKPYAWKYRDYVIRSFNADKPFDRFVKEQLAGDELPDWSAEAVIATGFYRLGVWDDEPADPKQSLYDGYDDIVTVIGQGFLGMTVNCARCHDHKKDPILQSDYYKLVAFVRDIRPFSDTRGVVSSNNTADVTPPEKRATYEAELEARNARQKELRGLMEGIENGAIKKLPAEDQRASEGPDRPRVVAKVVPSLPPSEKKKYGGYRRELEELDRKPLPSQELALAVNNCDPNPPPVYVLARGNPHAPKEKELCPPEFPAVLGAKPPAVVKRKKTSGRRLALANYVAGGDNPLFARVFVNRVWQHHFGKGIVPTPNDFGLLGEKPTHPELLDWLAADFAANGFGVKRLHRQLMLSETYRMSSAASPAGLAKDPTNNLLWRFNPRRLTAEEVRDSILAVSGKLDPAVGGPSVYPKIPKDVLAGQSVPGSGWHYDAKKPDAGNRRSVYVSVKRSLQLPILATHDQADTDSTCPVRYVTTVPTQALGMLNGEFTNGSAEAFAARLRAEFPDDVRNQVARGVRLTAGRTPTDAEVDADVAFVERMKAEFKLKDAEALTRYALLLLNANEFVYLD